MEEEKGVIEQLENLSLSEPSGIYKEDGPALFDLLLRFIENDSREKTGRISSVLNVLNDLRVDHRRRATAVILATQKDGKLLPYVVVWYDSPFEVWQPKTYAHFIVAFYNQFFNPSVNLDELGTFFDKVTLEQKTAVYGQLGRVLKFLHKESPYLKDFLGKLLGGSTGRVDVLLRSSTKAARIYEEIRDAWYPAQVKCVELSKTNQKDRLNEAFMTSDVKFLAKGLGVSIQLAEIVMHDYVTKTKYAMKCTMDEKMGDTKNVIPIVSDVTDDAETQ